MAEKSAFDLWHGRESVPSHTGAAVFPACYHNGTLDLCSRRKIFGCAGGHSPLSDAEFKNVWAHMPLLIIPSCPDACLGAGNP